MEILFFYVLNFIHLFIFGCAGSLLYEGFSLVVASGFSLVAVRELLLAVTFLVAEHGL